MASTALPGPGDQDDAGTASGPDATYDIPDQYQNLDELAATGRDGDDLDNIRRGEPQAPTASTSRPRDAPQVSRLATQLYTLSYLVFFSILGHARAHRPRAPDDVPRGADHLPDAEWGTPTYHDLLRRARDKGGDEEEAAGRRAIDLAAAKKAHLATKKTIPLYIGLATGFCGSFTSFSTFIRDVFLALSNDMVSPDLHGLSPPHRNGGYSFMALLAVIIETVVLSLGAYIAGLHLGSALEPYTPSIPFRFTRNFVDRLAVLLGWGCWIGAVIMAIVPPREHWRGTAVFAIVFAPLGCLGRFYLSLYLNSKRPSFPLGTFAANVLGTVILGMAWDIAHSTSTGGVLGCQLLQGVEDGFCGCLTTISTWVSELSSLRRRNSYIYGTVSVVVSTALMVIIMGSLRWTQGFAPLLCHP
ncbi:hypothetical protein NLG97_g6691 [Lecanicillium saksenae]|uniref:Uncharacterized protein n=1 Tax=Lecanicillium saksenae TaxID=468837 RepID=A0ACC1QQ29_9HYPO|nr:hypothetical protein NLG97_g6691 [Lecanicillium saksenae]